MYPAEGLWDEFYKQAVALTPKLLTGIFIFAAFLIAGRVLEAFLAKTCRRTRVEPSLIALLGRSLKIVVLLFGAVTALGTIGINVGALVAGLGLSGFALGFALKDALSNLLSGVSILLYHPFRVGDRISVTGLAGRVIQIDLRYTTLLDVDTEKRILIPNSNLFTNPLEVHCREAVRQPAGSSSPVNH